MILQDAFTVEPWNLRETHLDLDLLAQTESVFALANGHVGWRANLDEGEPHGLPGSYLNGVYELRPLPYAERAYGLPETGQEVINVTNGKLIRLFVDDEPFDVRYGELRAHERLLDFRAGVLNRRAGWVSPAGKRVRVSSIRLVSFTQRAVAAIWEFARTPAGQYPLMLHFPYFDLYRRQVVKQADLVLAMHLCSSAFTPEQKARNFEYYERLTVRDSSLSACTQAAIAAETGHLDLAFDYLGEAALMDLHDLEHNTRDGVHIASLAGTWVALVSGFGGLRDADGTFSFAPRLPAGLTRLAFTLFIRGRRLRVEITHAEARYVLTGGDALEILHHGQPVSLPPCKPQTRPIPAAPSRPRPSQPPGREPVRREPAGSAN